MIAYAHQNGDLAFRRGTLAIELPSKEDLEQVFDTHSNCTLIKIGVARLAKNRHFVKKEGRQYAEQNLIFCKSYLEKVSIRDTKHVYHFTATVENRCPGEPNTQDVEFGFSTCAESDFCQLVYAFVKEYEQTTQN